MHVLETKHLREGAGKDAQLRGLKEVPRAAR